jgi:hypothetical protein
MSTPALLDPTDGQSKKERIRAGLNGLERFTKAATIHDWASARGFGGRGSVVVAGPAKIESCNDRKFFLQFAPENSDSMIAST